MCYWLVDQSKPARAREANESIVYKKPAMRAAKQGEREREGERERGRERTRADKSKEKP